MSSAKRIMVTGGSGFIGRNIVEHFRASGSPVEAPSHKDLDLTDAGDVRNYVKDHGIEVIVHTANVGGNRKQVHADVFGTNIRMFTSVYHCRDDVEQIFHLGSGAEYDRRHYHPRLIEEDFGAHIPADDYGLSKYCMSELASSTDNITVFRIFGVFGPYEDYEFRFISNAIVKNLLGIPITIQQNVNFDYVWAPDIARILEKMLGVRTKFRHYNLCTGRSTDLKHLAELVNEISGKPVPVIIVNPGMNTEYTGDNSRLMNELNGFDFTTMNEAIAVLFRYYRQLLPKIDPNVIIADPYASRCDIKR